jgi:hypothetical protein
MSVPQEAVQQQQHSTADQKAVPLVASTIHRLLVRGNEVFSICIQPCHCFCLSNSSCRSDRSGFYIHLQRIEDNRVMPFHNCNRTPPFFFFWLSTNHPSEFSVHYLT